MYKIKDPDPFVIASEAPLLNYCAYFTTIFVLFYCKYDFADSFKDEEEEWKKTSLFLLLLLLSPLKCIG